MPGEEGRAREAGAAHLVGVPGQGVGQLRALHVVPMFGGEERATAPAGVHVEPEPVALTDVRHLGKRVIGTEDGGARRGADKERLPALLFGPQHGFLKLLRQHPPLGVALD